MKPPYSHRKILIFAHKCSIWTLKLQNFLGGVDPPDPPDPPKNEILDQTSDLRNFTFPKVGNTELCKNRSYKKNMRYNTILGYAHMVSGPNCITRQICQHNINQNILGFVLAKKGNVTVIFHFPTSIFRFPSKKCLVRRIPYTLNVDPRYRPIPLLIKHQITFQSFSLQY